MAILSSNATFTVVAASPVVAEVETTVLPAASYPTGKGRIVHPALGAFDYEYKPDEWVNIDGDVIVAPVWSSVKTLGGAAAALWKGNIKNVVVEERWTQQGASMPIRMLRMLLAIFTNPVDPDVGYVTWFPNYTTPQGYKVLPVDLVVGSAGSSQLSRLTGIGQQVIQLNDLVNYKGEFGDDGWVDAPVSFFLKMVEKL